MANGKSFYLTEKELLAVIDCCTEWYSIMSEGEESHEDAVERMNNGLGSALRKLYTGRNGQINYDVYKTAR
jgi:hypothetical protein